MAYYDGELIKENFAKRLNEVDGIILKIDDAAVLLGLAISDTPTADVAEVKHDEWIIDTSIEERTFCEVNYKILITCSICGNRHFLGIQPYRNFTQENLKEDSYRKYRYCGQCGAIMDGGRSI